MRAVANALVDGAEADAGSGHPTRWRVFTIGGREAYRGWLFTGSDTTSGGPVRVVALHRGALLPR